MNQYEQPQNNYHVLFEYIRIDHIVGHCNNPS
jgi:hypothetical protein